MACESCREAKMLLASEFVPEKNANDYIFSDEVGGWHEGYFASIHELLEYCEDAETEPPAYVFDTYKKPFKIDVERLLERALEDHYEDADQRLVDVDDL